VAGPGQWVRLGPAGGGLEGLSFVGGVWGWKGRWFGLKGLRE